MIDFDTPSPQTEHRFPCDNCGSDFRFEPDTGRLICDHCGNTDTITAIRPKGPALTELDYDSALNNQLSE